MEAEIHVGFVIERVLSASSLKVNGSANQMAEVGFSVSPYRRIPFSLFQDAERNESSLSRKKLHGAMQLYTDRISYHNAWRSV
jgi:hypothetical protein